jgi:hypothetical protein
MLLNFLPALYVVFPARAASAELMAAYRVAEPRACVRGFLALASDAPAQHQRIEPSRDFQ